MDITVKITEQPQAKALRFRYKCEGRSAGSLPGVRSTGENRTYPTIKVLNYKGPVFVVVSCVTVDAPFRPHPHNLVGRDCDKGVCTTRFESDSMECTFPNLGIQCVKKREVEETLEAREKIHVDPFGTGFAHKKQPQNLDLNAVRLCFQVFLVGANNEKGSQIPLKPVVSDPIYDKKATSDLNICKLSDCTSLVSGGKEIILLCDKVTKEDIQVKFTETKDEQVVWEALGDFQASDVHKQVAISFKTPKYSNLHVTHSVKVDIQLYRPSDGSKSEPRAFEYLPLEQGRPFSCFKRLKNNYGLFHRILGLDPSLGIGEESLPHKNPVGLPAPGTTVLPATSAGSKGLPRSPSPPVQELPVPGTSGSPSVSPIKSSTMTQPTQSVDDIKLRLTSNLDKKKSGLSVGPYSPPPFGQAHPWMENVSEYSDADLLEEVLSQGSVNDILSTMGDGLAVYEDVDALPTQYGDPSYASCYSNLEFVLGKNKVMSPISLAGSMAPVLPPKKPMCENVAECEDDFAIYGTPSGRPIHPNKEALLKERGFHPTLGSSESPKDLENNMYYSPVSDILEVEEESESQSKDITADQLPKTILDLFV